MLVKVVGVKLLKVFGIDVTVFWCDAVKFGRQHKIPTDRNGRGQGRGFGSLY
jgi:hypothetical protein